MKKEDKKMWGQRKVKKKQKQNNKQTNPVSLFNGISTLMGYLMPELSFLWKSSGAI